MIGGNPLNSHSFYKNKSLAAILVAIAIPVFTTQLEKSRESTDQANVRSAYAQVMTDILTWDGSGAVPTVTVNAQQTQASWQCANGAATITIAGGIEGAEIDISAKVKPATWTVGVSSNAAGDIQPSIG